MRALGLVGKEQRLRGRQETLDWPESVYVRVHMCVLTGEHCSLLAPGQAAWPAGAARLPSTT